MQRLHHIFDLGFDLTVGNSVLRLMKTNYKNALDKDNSSIEHPIIIVL
jgi:hypothetical protein